MTYEAIICRVRNVRTHPNADRIKLATVQGCQVVIGLDVQEDDLGVFFPIDGQLSTEYATANNLIAGVDENGNHTGGFFDAKRRVRAQRFRGEKSEGYWANIESLDFIGSASLKLSDGDRFTELGGVPICNKYYTPATLKQRMGNQQTRRRDNKFFAKHIETEQLKYHVDRIPSGSLVLITEKVHGTSARIGRVLDTKTIPNGFWRRLFRRPEKTVTDFDILHGTRNVIMNPLTHTTGFYGDEQFRYDAVSGLVDNLHKGEIIYGEIVGYTTSGRLIMSEHDTSSLKDIKKAYGPKMVYKYGQPEGTCKFYVYRITKVGDDGQVVELPWWQVKARCNELGVAYVPEMVNVLPVLLQENRTSSGLLDYVARLLEGPSQLDESHIREGVVVRVEQPDGKTNFYKAKSFTFGVLEGYIKQKDDYVDAEEIA